MSELKNDNIPFAGGEPGSEAYFTGEALVNILVASDETNSYSVGNVTFAAGCRNNWHTHPAGQILLITDGFGYYQERGEKARILSKGDVLSIPSHVEHWHGAADTSSMTHVVITNRSNGEQVSWLEPVSTEDYKAVNEELPINL